MFHLLFPLFSSVVFVAGMSIIRRATQKGASVWTGVLFGNLWIAGFWLIVALSRKSIVPPEAWGQAAAVALFYVLGQLFTYLAFQKGDVSVATPVMGVKVLMVAFLSAVCSGVVPSSRVWGAAALASVGVALVQSSGRSRPKDSAVPGPDEPVRRSGRSMAAVGLAATAAFALSLFDISLQTWGKQWESTQFLPVSFVMTAVMSLGFIPGAKVRRQLRDSGALPLLLFGTFLMALQAMSMSYVLAAYGDATRVNIVYSLRGLWSVLLMFVLLRFGNKDARDLSGRILLCRLLGAGLLTAAVIIAL